jgi:hypothetical protein
MKKIFLSLSQLEQLIFNKIVCIKSKQLDKTKASGEYKYNILMDEDKILHFQNDLIILFSAVNKIEIPEIEANLISNQFNIPAGLVNLVKRNIPAEKSQKSLFDSEPKQDFDLYTKLRKGLTALVLFGYQNKSYRSEIENFLKNFASGLNDIEKKLLTETQEYSSFPLIDTKGVRSLEYFRYVWWGKFVSDNIFKRNGQKPEEEQLNWLKSVDPDNLTDNKKLFNEIPDTLKEYSSVLLGYLLAALLICDNCDARDKMTDTLRALEVSEDNHYGILLWSIFFNAFFNERANNIFPNPLIKEDFFRVEQLAFSASFSLSEEKETNLSPPGITFKDISTDELIIAYDELLNGKRNAAVNIIEKKNVRELFANALLFEENRKNIGFIDHEIDDNPIIRTDEASFIFKGKYTEKPVTFYGSLNDSRRKLIKSSGICVPVKPLDKLIDNNKKVLIAFLGEYTMKNSLLKLYKAILSSMKEKRFGKFIVVLLIDDKENDLHSTFFALRKD